MDIHDKPAFPVANHRLLQPGMTLREYYAGQALGAIIAATSRGQHTVLRDDGLSAIQSIARDAVEMADALLAALANAEAP